MADQSSSSTGRRRRISEVDYSFGENYRYRSEVPFASFEERLQRSRRLFPSTIPIIRDKTHRFPNNEAATGYRCLSLRGFVVQGSLDPKDRSLDEAFRIIDSVGWAYTVMHVHPFYPKDRSLDEAFRIIDSVGWAYTVMHVHPFCPRVVREFISNKPFDDEGVLIRGHVFQFSPSVIDRLMMTPSVTQSFGWRDVVLKIDYAFYMLWPNAKISFGHLVYDQVIEMTRLTDSDTNLVFPNLIYQLLVLQHEVPLLPGDEEAIGRGLPIHGFA
ncbi:hypothetical protein F2Q69_00055466 [Brassica cretica]|uniref:Uncharacterized protein n=1 Tax=Brassica cretica TaxID=69181 RepID=A0A8S9N655_BRACR|nr:hypothetical protein F2Q69_00055466 [Brassica cretica]